MDDHKSSLITNMLASTKINRREFIRTAVATGVTMSMATSLWSSGVQAATPKRGGTLVQAMEGSSATSSIDPTTYTNAYDANAGYCLGQRLIANDPVSGDYTFELATAIDSPDGGLTWIVKLREGVEFHNGKTMTSADVLYSINRHHGPDSKSGAAGSLSIIKEVTATTKNEIKIVLTDANADLPFMLSDYHLHIQPEGHTTEGIGTGGYVMKEYRPGESSTFEYFKNYWGEGSYFDAVQNLAINDTTARTTALMTGKAHLISRVDPKTTNLLKKNKNITIENTSGRGHYIFPMHCNTAPFDNNHFRMALKLAMDREQMVDKILRGYGSVGNDIPINAAYPYFAADVEQRVYDPDKAAFHYKKSGHSGKVLLQTSNASFNGAEDASILFQQQAKKAGIEIDVQRVPADGYWDNIWNKQPFCSSYWSGRPTQDQMYTAAYISTSPWNDTRFFNDKFDSLLISARTELDQTTRKEIYRDMAIILKDEGGLINPMFNDFVDARASNLAGYVRDPLGSVSNGLAPHRCWFES